MEVFDMQNQVAIRLGNRERKYILVRHAQREIVYFSYQEEDGVVRTQRGEEVEHENRMSLLRFVNEKFGEWGRNTK